MAEEVLVPPIPGIVKFGYTQVIDNIVMISHFKDEDDVKRYLHSEFSTAMAHDIAKHLIMLQLDEPIYFGAHGTKFVVECGFIADLSQYGRDLRKTFQDFKDEMYLKAKNELRSERHH